MATQWVLLEVFQALNEVPFYHIFLEVGLLMWILWLIFHKSYNPKELEQLTDFEKEKLIEEWTPEPLVGNVAQNHPSLKPRMVSGKAGKFINVDGHYCLNMATHNYLGFVGNKDIEESAIKTLQKYGVGSCGPRGFYGTVDVHLDLEDRLTEFMKMEEAVVYSYGFSTIASAIPAYAKRGDVIFVDENVNFAIQKGLDASRSKIRFFKHNDMVDLERLLMDQAALDKKNPKKAQVTRRFLIVEGIYMNSGNICPLPELVELRKKYRLRIFVDESISFATLGDHGRGVTEYYNIPREEVDMISCSMEWSMATIGGFCVGSSFVVEHQRLSGLGYCFSASLPPLLAAAAITSLDIMEKDPTLFKKLQQQCQLVHKALSTLPLFILQGDPDSPVKHLYLRNPPNCTNHEFNLLSKIADFCIEHGIAVVTAAYLQTEKFTPRNSIRVTVNNMLTGDEINNVAVVLEKASSEVL
ncbi:serine palmitoyltransferase 1 [Zootermopsis nevadensis]|uniref:Serine palmitoyltransferase 1 n=1 Tax=Zootermopsis nevadensis TaxID=136037 RepID=A0A067RUI4_ZOONE|nr:serine palmitoyltransferase 1 [Zootermopsis nevadensis]KDR24470.1 Serine palmitoyltransferase 1 [Zootermopsis nevadensis]